MDLFTNKGEVEREIYKPHLWIQWHSLGGLFETFRYLYILANTVTNIHWLHSSLTLLVKQIPHF